MRFIQRLKYSCAAIPLLVMAVPGSGVFADPAPAATGEFQLSVVIVDDLSPKPVPFANFDITSDTDPKTVQTMKTGSDGRIDLQLPPGGYTVTNAKPVDFKGHSYIWSGHIEIAAGKIAKLDWSDSDARSETAKPARQIGDEGTLYQMRKSGVVTVEGDFGSGSGFVVDPSGLIITNEHVVDGGRWAAVRFDRGIRLAAVVVERDKAADVAVLCVNPAGYKDFSVVPLANTTSGPLVDVGERVVTIGSPLNQEKILTTGIISKVEDGYFISDININHGNSGGPLLNMAGDAIGLTTFLDSSTVNGPGISGIVSIAKAIPVLQRARDEMAKITLPSPELLPDISTVPIPEEAFTNVSVKDAREYTEGKPKNFETIFATPFLIAAQQSEYDRALNAERERRLKKRGHEGVKDDLKPGPSQFWERYALHSADPVVWVVVRPVLQMKSGSKWASFFGAVAGVSVDAKMEYRDDFYDMALYRGDTLVHPIRRFREKESALYDDGNSTANDNAYGGIYFYDPSVFAPGEKLKVYMRRESDLKRWDVVPVSEKEQARIYQMYQPYRAALAKANPNADSNAIVGLSHNVHTPPAAGSDWTAESAEVSSNISQAVTPVASPLPSR